MITVIVPEKNPMHNSFSFDIEENFYEPVNYQDVNVTCNYQKPSTFSLQSTFNCADMNNKVSESESLLSSSWPGAHAGLLSNALSFVDYSENDAKILPVDHHKLSNEFFPQPVQNNAMDDANIYKPIDDVFQVDKDDLVQGPTLAELNADSSLLDFDPYEFDDIILPEETSSSIMILNNSALHKDINRMSVYTESNLSKSSFETSYNNSGTLLMSSNVGFLQSKINEWMKPSVNISNDVKVKVEALPYVNVDNIGCNTLTSSAALNIKKEPEYDVSNIKQETDSSASPLKDDYEKNENLNPSDMFDAREDSNDEGIDSESDFSDHDDSGASDNDSDKVRARDKYFWQYNLQSKGPKTRTVSLSEEFGDPHNLKNVSDPVFDPECQSFVQGIKHTGKARRGDGNDLNPSPCKLYSIGRELKKLNRVINDMSTNDSHGNTRSSCRKEKNKLASRVCRLKKKAQHEANKLKLFALQSEHRRFINCTAESRKVLVNRLGATQPNIDASSELEHQITSTVGHMEVAGRTTEFINDVLNNVSRGMKKGGLETM